jgi:hypothetical protein
MKGVTIASLAINVAMLAFIAAGKLEFNTKHPVSTVNCNQVCMDYQATGSYPLIDGYLLKEMANNYQNPISQNIIWNNGPVTSSWKVKNSINPPMEDAHSAWFSLEDLKYFLWQIETKVCQNPCMNLTTDRLGVRIYYGRYPQGSPLLNGLHPEYENLHTVFMIPTFNSLNNSSEHNDFLLDSTIMSKSCKPIPIPSENGAHFTVRTYLLPNGKNHGDLCPPVCVGSAF